MDEGLKTKKRSTVRFTEEEFAQLKSDVEISGLSIPRLLKLSHFTKKKLSLLLTVEERHQVCSELRRIGNNVNQIAKRVNSGVLEGWYSEFQSALKSISELQQMLAGVHGIR